MKHNTNLHNGRCICSFSYGVDRIFVFTHPDGQENYLNGFLFTFNTVPTFWSIASGWDSLDTAIASSYAEYLGSHVDDLTCPSTYGIERDIAGENAWVLDDDTSLEFHDVFCDAMMDAGYYFKEEEGWVKPSRRKRKLAKTDPCSDCEHQDEPDCVKCQHN